MTTRYLNPKNDLAFAKVFGTEKHKEIPIDFLNAALCLEGEDTIIDLEFLNLRQTPEIDARKESLVDMLVKDQRGTRYIVEMQVAKVEGFEKRAQYYAAKTYCAHFNEGGKYYNLKKVIFLAITNYVMFPNKEGYKSDHVILDNKTYEQDLKDFSFTFVELPKFTKKLEELQTIEDQWYYFLKHADENSNIAEIQSRHPEIKQAYEILNRYSWTEGELQSYEKSIMNTADAMGRIDAARNDARREERLEIAKKLLENEMPIDQVIQITGAAEKEIKNLQSQSSFV